MTTFAYRPSFGVDKNKKPLVNVAPFGDGYSQRTAKGINNNPSSWSLNFSNLDAVTALAIDTMLAGFGGVTSFTWVDLDGNSGVYVCSMWKVHYADEDNNSVDATFDQVYGE